MSGTRIFARSSDGPAGPTQVLAYRMRVGVAADVAMILPLPVPAGCGEDAVHFIDLSGYPRLFDDIAGAFPRPPTAGGVPVSRAAPAPAAPPLVVHAVGAFDASFVPTVEDFDRLDARFRMPPGVWDVRPEYRDHGFAVFKLAGRKRSWWRDRGRVADADDVHPMAFSFPTRDGSRLFFPTVHVHDGTLPDHASFDHELYWQPAGPADQPTGLDGAPAATFDAIVDHTRAAGVTLPSLGCHRRVLRGTFPNTDTWIDLGHPAST